MVVGVERDAAAVVVDGGGHVPDLLVVLRDHDGHAVGGDVVGVEHLVGARVDHHRDRGGVAGRDLDEPVVAVEPRTILEEERPGREHVVVLVAVVVEHENG